MYSLRKWLSFREEEGRHLDVASFDPSHHATLAQSAPTQRPRKNGSILVPQETRAMVLRPLAPQPSQQSQPADATLAGPTERKRETTKTVEAVFRES